MAKRQQPGSAIKGKRASSARRRGNKAAVSQQSEPPSAIPASSTAAERLDYIAAMVQELKRMSAQADCRVLESLLELAYQEALQCRREAE